MASQAKVAEIYVELQAKTAQFKAALGEATNEAKKFSSEMRAQTHEARGALMLLGDEIGVKLPRELRNLVAENQAVARAINAAFSAIAVVGFITVAIEAGKKVYEFAQKNAEAAEKNKRAWAEVTGGLVLTNDQLRVSNDELEKSIAKLEGKPENNLKLMLDEAAVSADELGKKLDTDFEKFSQLLKSQSSSLRQQLFGAASTDDIEQKWKDLDERITEAKNEGTGRIRAARDSGSKEAVDDAEKEMNENLRKLYDEGSRFAQDVYRSATSARNYQRDWQSGKFTRDQLASRYPGVGVTGFNAGNMDNRIALSSGMLSEFGGQSDYLTLRSQNEADKATMARLTAKKDANAALEQEDAKRLKQFEATFAREKQMYGVSVAGERAFWEERLKELHEGTGAYNSVLEKFATSSVQLSRQFEKIRQSTAGTAPGFFAVGDTRGADALGRISTRAAEEQAKLNAEVTEATNRYRVLIGQITLHDAALAAQSAHITEYKAQFKTLNDELERLRGEDWSSALLGEDTQNHAQQAQIRAQIAQVQAQAKITSLTDAQSALSTTWKGMVDSVFDELIARSHQTQQQLQQIASRFVDGINTELAKGITGQRPSFEGVFRSASESLAKTGIEKVEGSLAKGLGFGTQRKGQSAADALYVQMAGLPNIVGPSGSNPLGAVTGGIGKSILGMFNDSNFFSKLFGGKLFGAGSILGGFAGGGDVGVGGNYRIGELGPETLYLPSGSHVVPNGGPGSSPTYNIDARGTDAAMVHAAVARAIRQGAQIGSAHAQRQIADRARRRPQG